VTENRKVGRRAFALGVCPFATQQELLDHAMAVVGDPGPVDETLGSLSRNIDETLLAWTTTRAYFSGINCGAAPRAGRARRERLAAAAAAHFAAARAKNVEKGAPA